MAKSIGIFGGTFDPVHLGHLRLALDVKCKLNLDEMRLMPCFMPTYRDAPRATREQRLVMLKLAVEDCRDLTIDTREIVRDRFTYSVDSLAELRRELGEAVRLYFVMGADSLLKLDSWHSWQTLTDYAHIVVLARPGYPLDAQQLPKEVAQFVAAKRAAAEELSKHTHGFIHIMTQRCFDISATEIRQLMAGGEPINYLVTDSVNRYLSAHAIYRD